MGNTPVYLRLKRIFFLIFRIDSYLILQLCLLSRSQVYCYASSIKSKLPLFFWLEEADSPEKMDFEMESWFLTTHFINSKKNPLSFQIQPEIFNLKSIW